MLKDRPLAMMIKSPPMPDHPHFDVLIIGSGAAGLGLALALADQYRIAIVCKDELLSSSSQYAQGGIAAVMHKADSYNSHIQDTLRAGDGLCHTDVVDYTVKQAKAAIQWLTKHGVTFNLSGNDYHLTQEGGHSHRRVLHHFDNTGAAIVKTLSQQALDHPNIHSFTQHTAIELIIHKQRCCGAYFLDNDSHTIKPIKATFTCLATGCTSRVYQHTTHPNHTTGDGIMIAANAGASIANLEFQQFHPTCFYNPNGDAFLITEVMRGEGATLVLDNGERFMPNYDPRAELAPRDIVTRAIHHEMKNKPCSHVYLDIRHQPSEKIKTLFPTIDKLCRAQGIDITQARIPVVPAAHYTCGGIVTNINAETDIPGLLAIGEVAHTGLHGANRMASNSLLECLVFAKCAGETLKKQNAHIAMPTQLTIANNTTKAIADNQAIAELTQSLRRCLSEKVGIIRNQQSLTEAKHHITALEQETHAMLKKSQLNKALLELKHLIGTAKLIIQSAEYRQESRGVHYRSDFPQKSQVAKDTIIKMTDKTINITGIKIPPAT